MGTSRRGASHDVLVVDDDDDVRDSFVTLLLMHGYRATGARSGFVALRLLRDGLRPRVVLLDLRMPGMDGWSVWEYMQATPGLASIPVVIVSGDAEESQRAEARGLRNFIRKPVDPDTLLTAVTQHCGR